MSNAFAIAAVTAALKTTLQRALTATGIDASLGGTPTVSALPPDRVNAGGGADPNQLNIFLAGVSPNHGWSNVQLPARDATGERVGNPPLSLDLHYVLTAFAASDYGAEILLGHGLQALHEVPFLGRQWLRDNVKVGPPPNDIPAALETAGLVDQVEQIRLTPKPLNWDEMSKIWTALQGRYRVSAAYVATVVLVERRQSTRAALPVLERNILVAPWSELRLDEAVNAAGNQLPLTAGTTLRLRGVGLAATNAKILVGGIDLTASVSRRTDTELDLALATPLPVGVRAGLVAVQVVQLLVGNASFSSNAAGFLLRPTLGLPAFAVGAVTVPFTPPVTPDQRVVLLLNQRQPLANQKARAYSFTAPARNGIPANGTETSSIAFPISGVTAGTYLVRLQVDGAESLLATDGLGRFDAPKVVIT